VLNPNDQVKLMTCGGAYERWFGTQFVSALWQVPAGCWIYRGQHISGTSSSMENLHVVLPNFEAFKKLGQPQCQWKTKLTWLLWYKKNANAWRKRGTLVPCQEQTFVRLLFLQTRNYRFYLNCELGHFLQLVDVGPLKQLSRFVKEQQLQEDKGFIGLDLERAL
jgi:hypothetical protein